MNPIPRATRRIRWDALADQPDRDPYDLYLCAKHAQGWEDRDPPSETVAYAGTLPCDYCPGEARS